MRERELPLSKPRRRGDVAEFALACEFAQEFALVHAVFEGLAAVDEDDGNFIGELAAEVFVGVDVNFAPLKASAALQLDERLFDDLAQVAALAGIHYDVASGRH